MTDSTTTPAPTTSQAAASTIATNIASITGDIESFTAALAKAATAITVPTALTALEGFLTALPSILNLIQELNKFISIIGGDNPQAYVANLGVVLAQWNAATTETEKENAAQAIASALRNLPIVKS